MAFANMERYADSEDIDVGIQKGWRFEDNLGRGIPEKMIRVSDEEKGEDMEETTQNSNVYLHRLPREDFSHHGFTARGHWEPCCPWMKRL